MGANWIKKIKEFSDKYGLLQNGDSILVCLSGGADSVCLLKSMCMLAPKMNLKIYAAHVNHCLRGKESDRDELFCKNLCSDTGVELNILRFDAYAEAKKSRQSVEAAARARRYEYFFKLKKDIGIDKIATAHNKNDNAETSIMNYMRGSGLDGIKGILPKRDDDIIRPLLCVSRREIEDFLSDIKQDYVTDSTNLTDIYLRNKIRLHLLPEIEKNYNPNIVELLSDNALILGLDAQYLNNEAKNAYKALVKKNKNSISIDAKGFCSLNRTIGLRVIRLAVSSMTKSTTDIAYSTVMRCEELFYKKAHKKVSVGTDIFARREYDSVIFENNTKDNGFLYKANIGEKIYVREADMTFELSLTDKIDKKEKNCEYFDYNSLKGQIYIRSRKNGDRFCAFGMNGTKKLKDFFIDEKIPSSKRNCTALVVCEDKLLWICGIRRSNLYKISNETKNILKIKFLEGKK